MTVAKRFARAVVPRSARNWLRSPSRSISWLSDSLKYRFGARQSLQIAPDWALICHPHAYKIFLRDQIEDPEQSAEFQHFLGYCAKGMFLFDIGCHFGIFSLAAARIGGNALAIDPSSEATQMVAVESSLNSCSDRITILLAAVSDASGSMGLLSSGVFSDGYLKVAPRESLTELTTVPAVTVDELTSRFGAPTHIKIDVEGHELAVIRGAMNTLAQSSPVLFLELHNEMVRADGRDPNATIDELDRLGYRVLGLNEKVITRDELLERPIIRVVARREVHR